MGQRTVQTFTTTIGPTPDVVFDYIVVVSRHAEWSPKGLRDLNGNLERS